MSKEISLQQVQLSIYQDEYFSFFVDAWKELDTRPLQIGWYQKFIASELQTLGLRVINRKPKENDFIWNCPPSMGKTRLVTQIFSAWLLAMNPGLKIIICSFSADTANAMNGEVRKLMSSKWYREYFPDSAIKADNNRITKFETIGGGSIETVSPGSQTTSKHASIIICDDFASAGQAYSSVLNQAGIDYYENSLKSRVESLDVPFIWVGQRYHSQDIYSHILSKPNAKFNHIVLPAVLSDNIQPAVETIRAKYPEAYQCNTLDCVRLNPEELRLLEESTIPQVWDSQYMQESPDMTTVVFQKDWCPEVDFSDGVVLGQGKVRHCVIDSAGSEKSSSDETCIGIFFNHEGVLYCEASYFVNYGFAKLVPYINGILGRHGLANKSKIYVENAGPTGGPLLDTLRAQGWNAIPAEHKGLSKEKRMESVLPIVMARRFQIIKHQNSGKLLSQFTGPLKMRRDDGRDVCTYGLMYLSESGSLTGWSLRMRGSGGEVLEDFLGGSAIAKQSKIANYGQELPWQTLDRTGGYRE